MRKACFIARRRKLLKCFAVIILIYILFKDKSSLWREEAVSETELPTLVIQRGNDHYFKRNIKLSLQTYIRNKFQWEEKKQKTKSLNSLASHGQLNVHIWQDICGIDLRNLKNHVLFPKYPSRRFYVNDTKFSHALGNFHFGEKIFGYIVTTTTGDHVFQIQGDSVEFWLARNSEPSSSRLVYSGNQNFHTRTFDLLLMAKTKYYFELLHKKSDKEDNFKLLWKTPGASTFVEISGYNIATILSDIYLQDGEIDNYNEELNVAVIHRKQKFPMLNKDEKYRNNLYKLPIIPNDAVKNVLPSCEYSPSYIVHHQLKNYKGVWETHYNSLYPVDDTNVTRNGWICLGNDPIRENEALDVVKMYMNYFQKACSRCYKLKRILSVEKNHDPVNGDRYLLELEVTDDKNVSTFRLSEYIYKSNEKSDICSPVGYKWNRNATVNIVLTVGGRQGRWLQHFINNLEEIYQETKDEFLNVIIIDFRTKDIDIKHALEKSRLRRYVLLHMNSKFHKSIGLQYAMTVVTNPNDIVFVCDLHLSMPVTIVDHIRKHCIQGKTTFNALLIRLDCGYTVNHPNGRWEHDGYGLIAMYKSDWDRIGGMDVERFRHAWGGEDWDLVDKILSAGLEIERLKVLNFFHFYHTKKGMWKDSEQ